MNLPRDPDELESMRATIKHLERENRALRVTVRDDFAKAALIGLGHYMRSDPENLSAKAYEIADAMMEARK